MVQVTFNAGKYIEELERRMAKAGVSQAALAREMQISATQATRWFTKNESRRRTPSLATVERIELAMARLERIGKRKAKA